MSQLDFRWSVYTKKDFKRMKWKNGKGSTVEYAIFPPQSSIKDSSFQYRLSSAFCKESGAFSSFKGYVRTLIVLPSDKASEKNEMILYHSTDNTHVPISKSDSFGAELQLFKPYIFSGDWNTYSLISNPIYDFNIIVKNGVFHSSVNTYILNNQKSIAFHISLQRTNDITFIYCLNGSLKIDLSRESHNGYCTLNANELVAIQPNIHNSNAMHNNETMTLAELSATHKDTRAIIIQLKAMNIAKL